MPELAVPPAAEAVALAWKKAASSTGHAVDEPIDLDGFLAEHHEGQTAAADEHLDPWLTLSAQGVLWLGHLHIRLGEVMTETARHRAAWALTGVAASNAVATRLLVRVGLDTAARCVLRNMIENVAACVACVDDELLAARYVAAQDDDSSRSLWRSELSGKTLRRRFEEAWRPASPDGLEAVRAYAGWLDGQKYLFSQGVHGSYVPAALACMSPHVASGHFGPAIFGHATSASLPTLETLTTAIWFGSRILSRQVLGLTERPALCHFDRGNKLHSGVVNGYYVLQDLMRYDWPSACGVSNRDDG